MDNYDFAAVLGTGSLAMNCTLYLKKQGVPCRLFDMNETAQKTLRRQAEFNGADYFWGKPAGVFESILNTPGRVLLVSAINPCLIPRRVLEKEGLRAVNCHQALLPAHPGRNAEMWAIFEEDDKTGITWHEMTVRVDAGRILLQKEFVLEETDTALSVFRRQSTLAYEAFQELVPALFHGVVLGTPQEEGKRGVLRYSWEVPGDGFLDPEWPGKKISAFLRAVDYGGLSVLAARPGIIWDGNVFHWKKYQIHRGSKSAASFKMEGSNLIICKDGYAITLFLENK